MAIIKQDMEVQLVRRMESYVMNDYRMEVAEGARFEFGLNWSKFLKVVDETRLARAEQTLQKLLSLKGLTGLSFLDIGCGSGLFSLAARRLGARVHSFDYDCTSVSCTAEMKRQYFPADSQWVVEVGSVLDGSYIKSLGQFDVVYSWGVLHHTGAMWQAITNLQDLVKPGGKLAVAIYNDQGRRSRYWLLVKKAYNRLPWGFRWLILWPAFIRLWGPTLVRDLISGSPFHSWSEYSRDRGMSPWRDVVDWVGGYPFEVAKPEAIFEFYQERGFRMVGLSTCGGGLGCNEFVFLRE
jgi:2-polyprenyl-6-hydroxyphenyl methylase/3-demethylubiquinone-9 3-methyltransferase